MKTIMKQYSLFTLMILLGTLIFNSCVDESMGDGEKKVVEGIPVGIKLSFVTRGNHTTPEMNIKMKPTLRLWKEPSPPRV